MIFYMYVVSTYPTVIFCLVDPNPNPLTISWWASKLPGKKYCCEYWFLYV